MKNIVRVGLILAAALIVPSSAFASTAKKHPVKTTKISLVCPVTGEKIASIKDAAGHSTYKGVTYYFCCSSCKPMFDKDPAKYIKSASAK